MTETASRVGTRGKRCGYTTGRLHKPSQRRSLVRQRAEVSSALEGPLLWNLMWPVVGAHGSFCFDNSPTCSISSWSTRTWPPATPRPSSTQRRSHRQPSGHGQSWCLPKPIPFGGMGKPVIRYGFSDHFPVTLTVTGADWVGYTYPRRLLPPPGVGLATKTA
jgi:hypothetical protein